LWNAGTSSQAPPLHHNRITFRFSLCILIISSGLALRGFGLGIGLPATVVKYCGSILWGAAILVTKLERAALIPRRKAG